MLENDKSMVAIGKRLRYIRKLAAISREELAKQACVGKSSISYWEHANDESSTMSLTSIAKVAKALCELGVECTERWLKTGTGPEPKIDIQNTFHDPSSLLNKDLATLLITNSHEQIQQFASLSDSAVIAQVDTQLMYPAFKQGDTVGGIWLPASMLETENLCIIERNEKLEIRRVIPTSNKGIFHIAYLTYDTNQIEPFELKDIPLEKVAPIIRFWR